jgi:hypothetical protein
MRKALCDSGRTAAALAEMETYCDQHPRSPTAVRRPQITIRGRTWVALRGGSLENGIAGFGAAVSAALRAFAVQYSNSLRSPEGPNRAAVAADKTPTIEIQG